MRTGVHGVRGARCATQPALATHGVLPREPRRCPQPAQPARASEPPPRPRIEWLSGLEQVADTLRPASAVRKGTVRNVDPTVRFTAFTMAAVAPLYSSPNDPDRLRRHRRDDGVLDHSQCSCGPSNCHHRRVRNVLDEVGNGAQVSQPAHRQRTAEPTGIAAPTTPPFKAGSALRNALDWPSPEPHIPLRMLPSLTR